MNPEFAMQNLSQSKYTRTDYVREQTKKATETLMSSGGKITTKVNSEGKVIDQGVAKGLPRKTAKRVARQQVLKKLGYVAGNLGASEVASQTSRRERRKQKDFKPKYNGNKPKSFQEAFGVGYERFNSKYVKVK